MRRVSGEGVKRITRRRSARLGFETLEPRHLLTAANLEITEFMATNVSTLASGDSSYDDWIEIHNADSTAVNLGDYYLTDNLGNLTKWSLPSVSLPAGGYLVVFASAPVDFDGNAIDNKIDGLGYYHTNFKLDSKGEELALTYEDPGSSLVSIVHQYEPDFPAQYPDVSYGIASDSQIRYFGAPTPGGPNGAGLQGVVADTKFSVDRGFYDAPVQVEITSDTPDAVIYYTTDGSEPGPGSGEVYTGALTIDRTTVLRAVATKAGYLPTNIDTQTYLFLADIVGQTRQDALDAGYPNIWEAANGDFVADYGFDPDVVGQFDADGHPIGGDKFGGVYAAQLAQALTAVPTISIAMDPDDLFLQDNSDVDGIYIDPRQGRNPEPERASSIEWITTDGSAEMQVDSGIQMQGGAFRSHYLTRKHSFRLVFKDEYGPSELTFPVYGSDGVDRFNTLVLKATANDGYSWGASQQTLQYARDQFGHSLQLDMGHASPHDTRVHLYLNGMYWGLYSVQERPDAEFAASYLGSKPDTWDAVHDDEVNSGTPDAWIAMLDKSAQSGSSLSDYMQLQGRNLDGTPSSTVAPLLDVENYIDYLIINVWAGNDDWPHHNFWVGRDRNPLTTEGFQFFLWDFDGVMGNTREWSPLDTWTFNQNFSGVGQAHNYLKSNAEYQLDFADRVHKYFFNEGLLTPEKLIARYQVITDQVEEVLVAESARWGDMHSATPLTPAEWEVERDWLLETYLPQRSSIVMEEMRFYGFYPDTVAPSFAQHGGYVPRGYELAIEAPEGTIYYTLDGTDPRLVGGAVSGSAWVYGTQPVEITGSVTVKARVLQDGEWSALNAAEFTTTVPGDFTKLRVTELQYHPADFASVVDDEDLEYLELLNTDSSPVSLDGIQIAGFASEPYTFDDGQVLQAGERIVVARNPVAFQSIYGTDVRLAPSGYTDRNLSNGGETVTLLGPSGQLIASFSYSDDPPWPTSPDGGGQSLEIIDPLGDASDPTNWRASYYAFGSPGFDGLPIEGDYDSNGVVDQADYSEWKLQFGTLVEIPGTAADGNGDGRVNLADYAIWRNHLGASLAAVTGPIEQYQTAPSMLSTLSSTAVVVPAVDEVFESYDSSRIASATKPSEAALNASAPAVELPLLELEVEDDSTSESLGMVDVGSSEEVAASLEFVWDRL